MKNKEKNSKATARERELALCYALDKSKAECAALKDQLSQSSVAIEKSNKALAERERKLSAKESACEKEYFLCRTNVQLLVDRLARLADSGAEVMTRSEITDLFKDLFAASSAADIKKAVERANEALGKSDEEPLFDLDAALNPQGDLDLKKLCEELGVYQG